MPGPFHLGFLYAPQSGRQTHDESFDPLNPGHLTTLARNLEDAGFAFLLIDDSVGRAAPARSEAFTTASFLATRTSRIGLIATANTSYVEPYNVTRLAASLDHVTHGRAGWAVSTGTVDPAGANYGRADDAPDAHYERAGEIVDIARSLWAVSYTHLDVYKRQVRRRPGPSKPCGTLCSARRESPIGSGSISCCWGRSSRSSGRTMPRIYRQRPPAILWRAVRPRSPTELRPRPRPWGLTVSWWRLPCCATASMLSRRTSCRSWRGGSGCDPVMGQPPCVSGSVWRGRAMSLKPQHRSRPALQPESITSFSSCPSENFISA